MEAFSDVIVFGEPSHGRNFAPPTVALLGLDTMIRITGWGGVASAILESLRYPLVN